MVRKDQGTVLVLDIGRNVSEPAKGHTKTFFEETRECAARIIERKIMSQGKSLFSVLLMGSKNTKNKMAEQCDGAFKRIEMLFELQEPSWKMIRELPAQPSTSRADWLDALAVAGEHLISGLSGVTITNRKIILITNFKTLTAHNEDNFNEILKGFVQENIEVDIIGPDLFDKSTKTEDYEIAQQLVNTTKGSTAPFSDTMDYLLFHRKKVVNPTPWNTDLEMGPNIRIPVSVYIKLKDEPVVSHWSIAVKDPITATSSTTEAIIKEKVHVNVENQAVVEPTEVIKGYSYGQKIIPFSECDQSMLYKSGDRCLSVYGYTKADNITWQNLNGDALYYVYGKKGDSKAQTAIRCLVESLQELKLVGVARKVHNKNNGPKMFVLMPVIDGENVVLSMAGLSYKDEIKRMAFPSTNLKKFECTDKQVAAFKDLIGAMDLMNAYDAVYDDDAEAFPTLQTVSPTAQYMMDCIAYRAMNPGRPLPPPGEHITQLFNRPPLIEQRMQKPLEQIKELFVLKEVETKTRNKKTPQNDDIEMRNNPNTSLQDHTNTFQNQNDIHIRLPVNKKEEITRIGTIDPVSDFKVLMQSGKTLQDLSVQMAEAIESLVYCNLDGNYSKALTAMNFFRDECIKNEPSHYNDWLNVFRTALMSRKKHEVVSLISEKKLGVILKDENEASPFEIDNIEDSQLYENDTIPETAELTIRSDINDLYDDL